MLWKINTLTSIITDNTRTTIVLGIPNSRNGRWLQGPQDRLDGLRFRRNRPVFHVPLHVLRQMVRSHELPIAHAADELLLPRVRALVPRKLVGSRELPAAVPPRANERPLPGVAPDVGFQMRRLEVVLVAARFCAFVHPPSLLRLARRAGDGVLRNEDQLRGDQGRPVED